jgi:hypothetical protein
MPENGQLCTNYGVYRSLCCNEELTVREGENFPDCPRHKKLTTVWKPVDMDILPNVVKKTTSDPAG